MAVEQLPGRVRRFARYLTDLPDAPGPGERLVRGVPAARPRGHAGLSRRARGAALGRDGGSAPGLRRPVRRPRRHGGDGPGPCPPRRRAHRVRLPSRCPGRPRRPARRMLREQRYAADRQVELGRLLASATDRQAAALRVDLAWARDDHARATARCAEIRARTAELDRRTKTVRPGDAEDGTAIRAGVPEGLAGSEGRGGRAGRQDRCAGRPVSRGRGRERGAAGSRGAGSRRRRRGGARFAGVFDEDAVPASVAPDDVPSPVAAPAGRRTPRGARFAGTAETAEQPAPRPEPPTAAADRAAAGRLVEALTRLRAEGRSGGGARPAGRGRARARRPLPAARRAAGTGRTRRRLDDPAVGDRLPARRAWSPPPTS